MRVWFGIKALGRWPLIVAVLTVVEGCSSGHLPTVETQLVAEGIGAATDFFLVGADVFLYSNDQRKLWRVDAEDGSFRSKSYGKLGLGDGESVVGAWAYHDAVLIQIGGDGHSLIMLDLQALTIARETYEVPPLRFVGKWKGRYCGITESSTGCVSELVTLSDSLTADSRRSMSEKSRSEDWSAARLCAPLIVDLDPGLVVIDAVTAETIVWWVNGGRRVMRPALAAAPTLAEIRDGTQAVSKRYLDIAPDRSDGILALIPGGNHEGSIVNRESLAGEVRSEVRADESFGRLELRENEVFFLKREPNWQLRKADLNGL